MIQLSLLGSTNSNFGEYPLDFLCFLETNFWEGKSSYQVNINHYLYPNDYNPSIGTFSFNSYLLVKRHFWYISNMKSYVLSIDTLYIYIYIYGTWIFTKKFLVLEFSTLFILQMNTLQSYIIITTYPCIYLYIYNNPPLGCNNICFTWLIFYHA